MIAALCGPAPAVGDAWAQGQGPGAGVVQAKPGAVVPGRYIVVLRDNVADPRAVANEMARAHGLTLGHVYTRALKGFAAAVPAGRLNALRRDPRVSYIEADQIVQANAQSVPTGIRRILSDSAPPDLGTLTIDGVDDVRVDADVAVIDTGIDYTHPDLNVVGRTDCAGGGPLSSSCDDGQGTDGHGHGSHVSGTIGGLDNGFGVVGVAPGARLWGVRVLGNNGSGYMSWVIAGVDWVAAHSGVIKVANMSLGGSNSTSLCQAIDAASQNVTFAVAAGNDGVDAGNSSPANCGGSGVITVSALADFDGLPGALGSPTCRADEDDTLANFSNWGDVVDIAAPGVCIESTWKNGGYNTISGTSMATPHVAGAAALLISKGITDPVVVRDTLLANGNYNWTDEKPGSQEPLLDVSNSAVFAPNVASVSDPTPTNTAPSVTIDSPADGATFATDEPITFSGTATDAEDGSLALTWTANGETITLDGNSQAILADGAYTIVASATDSGKLTGSDTVSITVGSAPEPPPATTGKVHFTLGCDWFGGKNANKNLNMILTGTDDVTSAPVEGATVSVQITGSNFLWSPGGTTGADGTVAFGLRGANGGTFTLEIVSVFGADWDKEQPTPDNICDWP